MLEITPFLTIDERELHFEYIRASGPGGQNINKVATAVQFRFDIGSLILAGKSQSPVEKVEAKRISNDGTLIIEAKRFRTQEQNRQDATRKFIALLRKASQEPKHRKKTKPTKASKEKRLKTKKHISEIKKNRRNKVSD